MAEGPPQFSREGQRAIGEFRGVLPNDPARMRPRPTRAVGDLMEELRTRHRIGRAAPEDAVRDAWPELVGPANAAYSHPVRIEGRRLHIQTLHSVVRNELFLHRAEIISRIQKLPGCGTVTELHIRSG